MNRWGAAIVVTMLALSLYYLVRFVVGQFPGDKTKNGAQQLGRTISLAIVVLLSVAGQYPKVAAYDRPAGYKNSQCD
jgi:hypothetical protein